MIAKATLEDITALNKLVNSAYRGDISRKGWTTEADLLEGTRTDENIIGDLLNKKNSTVLKFVSEGKILGCASLLKHGHQLHFGMFAVDPTAQSQGIGKAILLATEEEARKQGCKSIDMDVISERILLINWYKSKGYVEVGDKRKVEFGNPSFGLPKRDLYFITLEKFLDK